MLACILFLLAVCQQWIIVAKFYHTLLLLTWYSLSFSNLTQKKVDYLLLDNPQSSDTGDSSDKS